MQERYNKIIPLMLGLPFANNHNSLRLWSYRYHNSLRWKLYNKTFSPLESCDRSFASGSISAVVITLGRSPDRESEHQRKPSRRFIFLHKTANNNFATINEQRKTPMVAMEMKKYNMGLFGIAETRWIQSRHATGWSALISWELVSSRLIAATFRTKTIQDIHRI